MQKTEIGSCIPMPQTDRIRLSKQYRLGSYGKGAVTKTLLVMKLTILLLTAAFLNVHASTRAQTVTISARSISLADVFLEVEKQTDYVVFYNEDALDKKKMISLSVKEIPLNAFLKLVLADLSMDYSIEGKTIVLSRKASTAPVYERLIVDPDAWKLIIGGTIADGEGVPLSGVSVSIKGSNRGTTTGSNGQFQVDIKKGDIIQISSVGYNPITIRYDGEKFLDITSIPKNKQNEKDYKPSRLIFAIENQLSIVLHRSNSPLDQVQIIAYGKTTKRLTTGNIGTVKADEIEKQPVLTPLEALVGRIPGMTINSFSGNAASPMQVVIRGRNSINSSAVTDPLYVIDGVPVTTLNTHPMLSNIGVTTGAVQGGMTNTLGENPLLSINPRDIESIDVLKDADATAIYGSRGANGVILITTKRVKAGPTSLDIRINSGVKMLSKFPRLMNTSEYLAVRREALQNDGIAWYPNNMPDLLIWDTTKYTDWQREFIRTGIVTNIDASVRGGTNQTTYGLSAGYASQQEVMNNDGKNLRGNFRATLSHTSLDRKFSMNFSTNLAITEVKAFAIGTLGSVIPNAPDMYDSKGDFNFGPYRGLGAGFEFPFAGLKKHSESNTLSMQSSLNIRYEIVKGLSLSANAGYQFAQNKNAQFTPAASLDPMMFPMSSAYYGNSNNKNWTIEPQLEYRQKISQGNLNVQLLSALQSVATGSETIMSFMFPNDAMMKSYMNAAFSSHMQGYKEYRYVSMAAIVRYDWKNKYVLNLNGRRDGSARFGPGRQFGNFGSLGLAWIVSEEEWFRNHMPSWFGFLKFRASHGVTGSESGIGDYAYLSRWSKALSSSSLDGNIYPYDGKDGFHVTYPLNQDYHWESTRKSELGVNVSLFDNLVNIEFATYRNVSSNQLTYMPTPAYTGFGSVLGNFPATVENKGIELSVVGKLINTKDWDLSVNFNIGCNRNKLLSFPDIENSSYNGQLKVGESTSIRYLLQLMGVDPANGNYVFRDFNGDGVVRSGSNSVPQTLDDDRQVKLDLNPKYNGGFGFNLGYKSISLSGQFSFINTLRNNPYLDNVIGTNRNSVLPAEISNNHWKSPGDVAKYARYTSNGSAVGPVHQSDAGFIDGSHVRMTNLTASWKIPTQILSHVKIKNAAVSIQTQNLFFISRVKGINPDITNALMVTPIPRTITAALSFNF